MIKLWVSDLDGTLLDHHKQVSIREQAALRWLEAHDISYVLASGRMRTEMIHVMSGMNALPVCISQNGAFIHLANQQLYKSHFFDPSLVRQVYASTESPTIVRLLCSGEANYIRELTPASDLIQARMFEPFRIVADRDTAVMQSLPVCKLSYFGDMEELLLIKHKLDQNFSSQVTQFVSDKDCLDIMPFGVSKGSALLDLLDLLAISPDEVACIGDSFNDISMFEVTPHSFAMIHSHDDVKKTATYVVQSVAEAIYMMGSRDGLRL
jgi:Cof subfamily protein (haloacid dehalogenase superfamily)